MPVEIIRRHQTASFYTSPERLYLTADGEVVGAKDPRKQTLLVAAGGQIPTEDARRYGLLAPDTPVVSAPVEAVAETVPVAVETPEIEPPVDAPLAASTDEAIPEAAKPAKKLATAKSAPKLRASRK